MPIRYFALDELDRDALIERVLERSLAEIPDLRALPEDVIDSDVRPMTRWHTEFIRSSLEASIEPSQEIFRNSTVRRIRQGVSVQSLIRYYELWAEEFWTELSQGRGEIEPAMALRVASHLATHLETAREAVSRIYLEETAGSRTSGQRLRPDLLDALVSTQESDDFVARVLITLQIDLEEPHVVMVLRHRGKRAPRQQDLELALLESVRMLERAPFFVVANGIRHDDVVLITTLGDHALAEAEEVAHAVATQVPGFSVGISGALTGTGAIGRGYRSALTGMSIAPGVAEHRAYTARDARLNRIFRHGELADALRGDVVGALEQYDREHGSDLLLTARIFLHTNFNAKLTAEHLHLQPNTVRYRLGRIRELTGSDPLTADGILEIMVALRSQGPS
ncbi:PucR family transcriptional regulator [Brachybacterium sp. AOP29-B2-41]|uniref:PucR family transcriptional regulator n=1 Tax=Brachybacterium sp. AOP29-B2-41 TaxID=3457704 RepID=UPI00403444DB